MIDREVELYVDLIERGSLGRDKCLLIEPPDCDEGDEEPQVQPGFLVNIAEREPEVVGKVTIIPKRESGSF